MDIKDKLNNIKFDWDKEELWNDISRSIPKEEKNQYKWLKYLIGLLSILVLFGVICFDLDDINKSSVSKNNTKINQIGEPIVFNKAPNSNDSMTRIKLLDEKISLDKSKDDQKESKESSIKHKVNVDRALNLDQRQMKNSVETTIAIGDYTKKQNVDIDNSKIDNNWVKESSILRNEEKGLAYLNINKEKLALNNNEIKSEVNHKNQFDITDNINERFLVLRSRNSIQSEFLDLLPVLSTQLKRNEIFQLQPLDTLEELIIIKDLNNWSVEFNSTIALLNRKTLLSKEQIPEYNKVSRNLVKTLYNVNHQILVGRKIWNNFFISSGFRLERNYEQLRWDYDYDFNNESVFSDKAFYINEADGSKTYIGGMVTKGMSKIRTVRHLNRLDNFSIPIEVAFVKKVESIHLKIYTGLNILVATKYYGKDVDFYNEIIENSEPIIKNRISYSLGFSANVPIYKKIFISGGMHVNRSATIAWGQYTNTYYAYGIQFGLNYYL